MTTATVSRERAAPSAPASLPYLLPRHEITGPPDAPVVLVLGGISSTCHVTSSDSRREPGWWEDVVGRGGERAIDTNAYRALGVEFLDGGRAIDGRPLRVVTTYDQADAIASLLERLEIPRLHALVGASYGGMVGLALAERYPELLERLIVTGAADVSHPLTTALRAIQRRIVSFGLETGRPRDSLVLARALATTTYRSAREFEERFGEQRVGGEGVRAFAVEDYLLHNGERFASICTPERFLALSLSADLHRVRAEDITVPTLLIAAEGDALVPEAHMDALARRIGAHCKLVRMPAKTGHDAFLAEPSAIGPILRAAICGEVFP
jgi:homoserine O-acetyltransferase/O-succinyltransferase